MEQLRSVYKDTGKVQVIILPSFTIHLCQEAVWYCFETAHRNVLVKKNIYIYHRERERESVREKVKGNTTLDNL